MQIFFEPMLGSYTVLPEFAVIVFHRFFRFYFSVGDQAQHADEFQRML